jgi:tRNA threonylcarbamoyladenosine biosynthesis protein TsaB
MQPPLIAPPLILAIDTATGPCSAAVWAGGRVAAYREEVKPTQQSASLMGLVEGALHDAGVAYAQLSVVACTTGPGSFTGIRVGLSAASGICFAADIAGVGFTSLETLAWAAKDEAKGRPVLSVLNAGKGEVYYQAFATAPFAPLCEARLGTLEAAGQSVENAVQAGNMALAKECLMAAGSPYPRADALAAMAAQLQSPLTLRPFYIRPPDAKLPNKGER